MPHESDLPDKDKAVLADVSINPLPTSDIYTCIYINISPGGLMSTKVFH